jgi:hypothetical protein
VRNKQSASSAKHQSNRKQGQRNASANRNRNAPAQNKRIDYTYDTSGNRQSKSAEVQQRRFIGSGANGSSNDQSLAIRRSAYVPITDIDGESPKRQGSYMEQGPLYPGGWESVERRRNAEIDIPPINDPPVWSNARNGSRQNQSLSGNGGGLHVRNSDSDSANQRRVRFDNGGGVSTVDLGRIPKNHSDVHSVQRDGGAEGDGLLNSHAPGEGGGLWNDGNGYLLGQSGGGVFNDGPMVTQQSPFHGQDQETGKTVDFRANFRGQSPVDAATHSIVDSEGWDEVPEEWMFGFRTHDSKGTWRGIGPTRPAQIDSPRDPASGQASGKR